MRTLGLLILTLLISPAILHNSSHAYQEQVVYVCPMHSEVQSAKPGICPKCEMKLEAKKGIGSQGQEAKRAMMRHEAARRDLDKLADALERFKVDVGRYPTKQEGILSLVRRPTAFKPDEAARMKNWIGPYLKIAPEVDPWGNDYVYQTADGGISYKLFSYGPDGKTGSDSLLYVASPSPAPQSTGGRVVEVVPQAEGYTCSMHPDVRVTAPGKCPKCGMPLVAVVPAITDEFDLKIECSPRAPKPNEKVRLRFSLFNPKTGEQAKSFQIMHEQLFHLFIISQDMNHFQHIHPDFQPDGSFTIETVLPQAGRYKVFSDFYPTEGAPQVLQQSITTAGHASDLFASQARLAPDTSLVRVADGIKVELKLEPAEIIAGQPVALKYHLTDAKTAEPIKDLLPYLGAWGHTLILSEDQSDYVHSHPEESVPETAERVKMKSGPDVTFEALMPRPGIYRIWTQFLRGKTLTTVSFTVRAERLR